MSDLRDLLPPVRDQGDRYTCLSMALSDGHHAARGIAPSLAADFLHFHATAVQGVGINDAVSTGAAMLALEDHGQPAEGECPYSPAGRPTDWKPKAPQGDVWRRRTSLAPAVEWKRISEHLDGGRPLALVFDLDDAFWEPVARVVEASCEPVRGSHAVLAMSVDSETLRVLVRNSWGKDWSDGGYAWLSSQYVEARCTAVIAFEGAVP